MMLLIGLLSAAFACDDDSDIVTLDNQVSLARSAFAAGDEPVMRTALVDAEYTLGCLIEPLGERDAARMHLAWGLSLWDPEAPEQALPYLSRYASAFPSDEEDGGLPSDINPAEELVFEAATEQLQSFEPQLGRPLPPALRGQLQVDGQGALRLEPQNQPWVLQRTNASGWVLESRYVQAGDPAPRYRRLRPALSLTAVGGAAVSAGLFTGAWLVQRHLESFDPEVTWPYSEDGSRPGWKWEDEQKYVQGRQAWNQGLFGAGVATAAVSVMALGGLGVSYVW